MVSTVLAATFLGVTSAWLGLSYRYLPHAIPFWYSLPWGEGRLAPRIYLFYLVLGVILLGTANLVLARVLKENPLLSYTLTVTTTVLAALASITIVYITRLWLP